MKYGGEKCYGMGVDWGPDQFGDSCVRVLSCENGE